MSATEFDGTAEEIGAELVVPSAPPAPTLFRTDDPLLVIERATAVANALKPIIAAQELAQNIQGKDHVKVEGWTTLGAMLGVFPVLVWARRIEPATEYDVELIHYEWITEPGKQRKTKREKARSNYTVNGYDWEARYEARTIDGRVVGAAEGMCSRTESKWAKDPDYALRSMAQTRATSRALRGPLGFIITLAGYSATPAEEVHEDMAPRATRRQSSRPAQAPPPAGPYADAGQIAQLKDAARELKGSQVKLVLGARGVTPGNTPETFFDGVPAALVEDLCKALIQVER